MAGPHSLQCSQSQKQQLSLSVFTMNGLFAHTQAQCDRFSGEAGLPGFPDQRCFRASDFLLQLGDGLQGFSRSFAVHGCNMGLHPFHLHASTLVDGREWSTFVDARGRRRRFVGRSTCQFPGGFKDRLPHPYQVRRAVSGPRRAGHCTTFREDWRGPFRPLHFLSFT